MDGRAPARRLHGALSRDGGAAPSAAERLTEIEGPDGRQSRRDARALANADRRRCRRPSSATARSLYAADIGARVAGERRRTGAAISPARSVCWRVDRASEALEPSGVRPLYVRRPDVGDRERRKITYRRKVVKGHLNGFMGSLVIEPLTPPISTTFWRSRRRRSPTRGRGRCTSPSWRTPACRYCFLARDERRQAVGFCSFWRVARRTAHQQPGGAARPPARRASGPRCCAFVLQKGVELGAQRATLEVRRSNEVGAAAVRAVRLLGGRRARGLLLQTGRGRAGAVARRTHGNR